MNTKQKIIFPLLLTAVILGLELILMLRYSEGLLTSESHRSKNTFYDLTLNGDQDIREARWPKAMVFEYSLYGSRKYSVEMYEGYRCGKLQRFLL